jgi:hypothetical protein
MRNAAVELLNVEQQLETHFLSARIAAFFDYYPRHVSPLPVAWPTPYVSLNFRFKGFTNSTNRGLDVDVTNPNVPRRFDSSSAVTTMIGIGRGLAVEFSDSRESAKSLRISIVTTTAARRWQ